MTLPTRQEIKQALDAIDKRGPCAPETIAVAMLAVKTPELRAIVDRMADGYGDRSALIQAALMGAFVSGLNIGLTLKESAAR